MKKPKAKIAFFDFASCEGCQIELTNLGEEVFSGLLEHVEFVEFREVMKEQTLEPIDIAFVEGAYTREADIKRLQDIRARSRFVVAFGACAATAGITALKNHHEDYRQAVYGAQAHLQHLQSQKAQPISAAIKVDFALHGCPMDKDEFVYVVSHLLHGKEPVIPNYPVCMECKMRQTVCRYQDGDHCMGLVARAGCGAPCPADGIPCEACRGFVDHADQDTLLKVLNERGRLTHKRAQSKAQIFAATLMAPSGADGTEGVTK